jgi:hypothetical protein
MALAGPITTDQRRESAMTKTINIREMSLYASSSVSRRLYRLVEADYEL